MITVNGQAVETSASTLGEYLASNGYQTERIAVEYNKEIIARSDYSSTVLKNGDVIEIVCFVGGG